MILFIAGNVVEAIGVRHLHNRLAFIKRRTSQVKLRNTSPGKLIHRRSVII